jgi:uncharacterized cysteine cluster protein YcgN (CxxCxxCC family)
VRAPDENLFIPPFNLIEIFVLITPFEWWLPHKAYQRMNRYVMAIIYSPLLLVTSALEAHEAHIVHRNRLRKAQDDDTVEEWEQLSDACDSEWVKKVEDSKPDVEVTQSVAEIRKVQKTLGEVRGLVVSAKEDPTALRDDDQRV